MHRLLFGIGRYYPLMAEEGGEGGGGTGGEGAGTGAGTGGADGGEGMFGGTGGEATGAGEAQKGGALGAGGEGGEGGEGGDDAINWDTITDDEYFGKVQIPTVDGVNINSDFIKKNYGEFLRKHHISPEAVADYLKLEGGSFKKAYDEAQAKSKAENDALAANFQAQGKALREAYSPEQIQTAVKALSSLSDDKDFMDIATLQLSNNKTLVKLLLNYAEHNSIDDVAGAGAGAGTGGLAGFAERWTGKRL